MRPQPANIPPRCASTTRLVQSWCCRRNGFRSDSFASRAEVAELADAHGSGPCTRKGVGVRVPSSAPILQFNLLDQGILRLAYGLLRISPVGSSSSPFFGTIDLGSHNKSS